MSVLKKEVIRIDNHLKAYVVIQNDWTGSTKGSLREIHLDGSTYYINADGHRVPITEERQRFLLKENEINTAMAKYKQILSQNSWIGG